MRNSITGKISKVSLALLTATCLTAPHVAHAQLTAADNKTTVYNAPNNVPVVDIAKANAAGLSHNRFTDYNVDSRGVVLNNGNTDQIARQSQLAGQVLANMNLTNQASVILNEVVSTKRSTLAGFTEVLGGKADVVVANPNGITCNGCGFINTSHSTLTTGVPQFAGDGSLSGFQVDKGDILIVGNGMNDTSSDYTSLVARSVSLQGQVNASTLDIIAGPNDWDYTTNTATARTATGTTPTYAVDSSALGGMYANKIRLIATEAGVGVRMAGDAAAASDDFTIDSSGKVEITGKVSAGKDVSIATSASGTDAIHTTDAKISSTQATTLSATNGNVHMEGGLVSAGTDLTVNAASLTDASTPTGVTDNNKRYAGHNLAFTTAGASTFDSTIWGAGNDLTGNAGTLTVGSNGATIYSGGTLGLTSNNALTLGKGFIKSQGDMSLTSTTGGITTTADTAQGIQSVAGNILLTAANGLTNPGKISADAGNLTARVSGTVNNSGTMHAGGTLGLADKTNASTETLTNSGTMLADTALNLKAAGLTNSGTIQGGTGASTVAVTNTLTNNSGAKLILSKGTGTIGDASVSAATIDNTGLIQSKGNLALNATSNLYNRAAAMIYSQANLVIRGLTAAAYAIHNYATIRADSLLDIKGNAAGNAVNVYTDSAAGTYLGNTGDIKATLISLFNGTDSSHSSNITTARNLTLNTTTLTMGGAFTNIVAGQSSSDTSTITVGNNLDMTNGGGLFATGTLTVTAPNITLGQNAGFGSANTLHLSATGNIINNGSLFAGSLLDIVANGTFRNQSVGSLYSTTGTVYSMADITVTADTFDNRNNFIADRDITINADKVYNDVPEYDPNNPGSLIKWNWDKTGSDDFYPYDQSGDQDNRNSANAEDHDAVIDWVVVGNDTHDNGDTTHWFNATFKTYQYYTTTPTHKPELLAGRNLTITNFTKAVNGGGIISGNDVYINSTKGGATFINDDLSLETDTWEADWNNYVDCDIAGNFCDTTNYRSYNKSVTDASSTSFGAGIFANHLHASGFGLSNVSSTQSGSGHTVTGNPGTGTTSDGNLTPQTPDSGASFGGITITLPGNPNGFFVTNPDPKSKYLVETNPRYGVGSNFVGSDYLAERLGVDLDTIQRRLGDANYEADLIRQQLINATGSNIIKPGEDEAQQMQRLMDQGADTGKALGLTFGVAPTASQIANLKEDMVWMVSTKVNGVDVLAPVVYLSAATKAGIASGAVIAANDIDMNLDSLTNKGGTIKGANSVKVASAGDITNLSGTISGGDVSLKSTNGSIVNETYASTSGSSENMHTVIGKGAGITATGNLDLDAKNDITNKGAQVSAGGDASLKAGNNITFDTIEDKEATTTHSGSGDGAGGLFTSGTNTTTSDSSTKNIKSGLTVGGNLNTKSGNDTTFAGTDVKVGGSADLDAGNNLNIIARNDSESHSKETSSGNVFSGSTDKHTESSTTNVGSSFDIGGDLKTKSKNDTTIQGSDINVKGNGDMSAGGNFNILDGQNTKTTSDSHSSSGIGVGGGVYGISTDTDEQEHDRSVASNLNFGGNGKISSDKTVTVQGSNVSTGGDLDVSGTDVKILEGRDVDKEKHTNTTVAFGKVDTGSSGSSSDSGSDSGTDGASASANASANANANASGGVSLVDATTETTNHYKSTAVGSNLKSGGSTTLGAKNGLTVSGSTVDAGGDVNLNAKDITVKAAENIDTTTTSTMHAQLGLYGSSDNNAGASADASAQADAADASADKKGVNAGGANASAGAHAGADASSENTLDFMRTTTTDTTTTDITHTGSLIKSGGNMKVKADNTLAVNGSDMEAGGDVDLKAKDMSFTAATDSHTTTTKTSKTSAGLYADASSGAHAGADASADSGALNAGGSASADAEAEAGVGYQMKHTDSSHAEGTTTAKVSTIKSGGNMTREADNNITDEGTNIDAGGDFTQKATTWDSKAAKNTSFSTDSSETNSAKMGLYAEAGANASGGASAQGGVENDAGATASVGVSASYKNSKTSSSSDSSEAVVSNIKSGGKMSTTTTGKTSLEGTNLESGGDMDVNAGSLDYKAAHNTESSSSSDREINAGGKVGIDATKAVSLTLQGGYDNSDESDSSSHAVTGSMKSGGKLNVKTAGDANFEGTNIASKGDAAVDAGGSVNFDAAHDTESHTGDSQNASASLSLSKSGKGSGGKGGQGTKKGIEAEGGFDHDESSSDTAVTGSIQSGGNLSVKAGKDATFTGTQLSSDGDASVDAKGNVNFNAAKSTATETSYGASASIGGSGGGKDKDGKANATEGKFGAEGNYAKSDSTTSTVAGIKSGGKVAVKSGNDTNLEGTNIESAGKTSIDAGHDVNFKAATDTSSSIGFSAGIGGSKSTPGKKEAGAPAPAAGEKEEKAKTSAEMSFGVAGGSSTTKTGGSIKAGSLDIKSGHDANLEGTQVDTKGDASITAKNNVNLTAAKSTEVDGSIGLSGKTETEGTGKDKTRTNSGGTTGFGIGGQVDNQGVGIKTGGNLAINSGGKTTMTATQADVGGSATINAGDGIEKNSAVSGGGQIGTTRAGANMDIQGTDINAKGGVTENGAAKGSENPANTDAGKPAAPDAPDLSGLAKPTTPEASMKNLETIAPKLDMAQLKNAKTPEDKKKAVQAMMDKLKNDKTMTPEQKEAVSAQLQNLMDQVKKSMEQVTKAIGGAN